jgi:branched-chain amino acid aminotransferase|tara:strand:+ start:2184 stop:3086 length:903 start_codon:yes stop_codon:yes gene_type:complete
MSTERVAYVNGEILPESQASVSINDRGFLYGDAVFDTTRTFNGEIFRLEQHLDRFYESLRYMRIDSPVDKAEMKEITLKILDKNLEILPEGDDYWVSQRVSRGVRGLPGGMKPTIVIECFPLPLQERAEYYRDGIKMITSSIRRTAPESLSPRAKMHNYINLIQAELEVQSQDSRALALLLDVNGNLCEGHGANIFLVNKGVIYTPREQFVLAGISRQVTIELADNLGYEIKETDLDVFDAYTADEIFVTSTSFCICPVSMINGLQVKSKTVPGDVTLELQTAYSKLVKMDFVKQYLDKL